MPHSACPSLPCPDFIGSDTIEQLRRVVQDFAQAEIAPIAAQIDRSDQFPRALWPKLGDLGLLGISVDEDDGGSGFGYLAHLVAMEEISRVSASVGLSYAAHSNLCVNQIALHGTARQKACYLAPLIGGQWVGALAMSEPGAGSDVSAMTMRAVPDGDGWVLTGCKMWITNGPDADLVLVYAKTSPDKGIKGISAFLVETTAAGFHVAQKLDKLGMRGSSTGELVFDQVRVGPQSLLGSVDGGLPILMSGLDYERLVLTGGPLGIMAACLDAALPHMHQRQQFGRAIGEFQLMQGKMADLYVRWQSARAWAYGLAACFDRGQVSRQDAAALLLFAAENATQAALQAIQSLGGMGYVNDTLPGRLLRDAKLYEIGAGTSEIRRMLVGRELFRASREWGPRM